MEAYNACVAFNPLGLDPSLAWRIPQEIVFATKDLEFWRGFWHGLYRTIASRDSLGILDVRLYQRGWQFIWADLKLTTISSAWGMRKNENGGAGRYHNQRYALIFPRSSAPPP